MAMEAIERITQLEQETARMKEKAAADSRQRIQTAQREARRTLEQARQVIVQQSFIPMWDTEAAVMAMANIHALIRKTPVYRVFCGSSAQDAKAIHDNFGDDFDVLFGPAYKGIPLSVATTIAYSRLYGKDIRYCSNRKEIKDHGDVGILLGSNIKDGDRVVIIEDVTTSGKSI